MVYMPLVNRFCQMENWVWTPKPKWIKVNARMPMTEAEWSNLAVQVQIEFLKHRVSEMGGTKYKATWVSHAGRAIPVLIVWVKDHWEEVK
jgi:hypothetical protein